MVVIKKIGVFSAARIQALLMAVLGLIEGVLIAIFTSMPSSGMALQAPLEFELGVAAIIVLPIIYALIGLLIGALGAWLYNGFAKLVGGVEVELEEGRQLRKAGKKR